MTDTRRILILNGPNLNLLGKREPEIYGTTTLDQIRQLCEEKAASRHLSLEFRQTNDETTLIEWVQHARESAMIINAAAFTHTSVALHDALKSYSGLIIEVHLSNIYKREHFRHTSYVSPVAHAVLCGFGADGYLMALEYLAGKLPAA
jgi:3-dehydroquinate dehydratase II